MQIGFNLPVSGPMADPAAMQRMAQLGEALGFSYLTLTDHIALPDTSVPGYPYSESGAFYSPDPGHRHEQLMAASWIAAKTERIRIVLAVMVVPHRPAVLAAKMLASLDVLSGGRLTIGIGAGWLQPELEAVALTPFAERGAVTDEYIDAFRTIWTQDRPEFTGKYVRCKDLIFEPKPVQRPHPPLWIGGESGPSMRRAARVGDAWYPIGSNNAHLLDTHPRLAAGIARLRALTEKAGRDPAAVGVVFRVKQHAHAAPPASDGERRLFSGTIDDVLRDIEVLRKLGVQALDFDFEGRDAAKAAAQMERFRGEVLARI